MQYIQYISLMIKDFVKTQLEK